MKVHHSRISGGGSKALQPSPKRVSMLWPEITWSYQSDPEQIFLEPRKPGDDQHKIQEANRREVSMEMMKNRLGVDPLEVLLILLP